MIFLKQEMCALLQADEDVLRINVMPVQRQTISVDWGIFAMAFLTCILCDEDEEGLLQRLVEFTGAVVQLCSTMVF